MNKYTRTTVNMVISDYKLNLFYEIQEIQRKSKSSDVYHALNDVIRLLVDDVVEKKMEIEQIL